MRNIVTSKLTGDKIYIAVLPKAQIWLHGTRIARIGEDSWVRKILQCHEWTLQEGRL